MRRLGIVMILCSVLMFSCKDKKQTEKDTTKSVPNTESATELSDTTVVDL